MKTFTAESLSTMLYIDRLKTKQVKEDTGEHSTVRSTLIKMIDTPIGKALTPSRMRNLDRLWEAFSKEGDVTIDDSDLEFLKQLIDEFGVQIPMVYKQLMEAVDAASKA